MMQRPSPFPQSQSSSSPSINGLGGMAAGGGAPLPMLEISIQRLEDVLDQETAALKAGGETVDLKAFNDRKSQALLELTRWMRNLPIVGGSAELAARVARLKEKLVINQTALNLHLEAVREIATSMSDAIKQSESDGTYTQSISSAARRYYD